MGRRFGGAIELSLGIIGGLGMLGFIAVALAPRPESDDYAGSSACRSCHRDVSARVMASQHQKMMRPANQPGVLVADFDAAGAQLPFLPDEVVWVIGGKWEQQFMGHDGTTETLLPGAWHASAGEWEFRGWDGWDRPIPLVRCHGCHTVGLDVETGEFVEANIGCESCHGPSAWHAETWGIGRVHSGVESEVCGQCHSRGLSADGRHFFPVAYRPGGTVPLGEAFEFNDFTPDQDSSHWWGNGHARERHQEYSAWVRDDHAQSLETLRDPEYDGRYGEVGDDCLPCHSGDHRLAKGDAPSLADVEFGITCAVCHESHGPLDRIRTSCADCHGEGASHHRPEINAAHVPCPLSAGVGCVDCHMPATAAVGGHYQLHSHAPGFVAPNALADPAASTGCTNASCHVAADRELLQARFERHYGKRAATSLRRGASSSLPMRSVRSG